MAAIAATESAKNQSSGVEEAYNEEERKISQECKDLLVSLPREKGWHTLYYYLFQGFWCPPTRIQAITSFQKHFQAKGSDILVATLPKSGTTWVKALAFAIVNRHHHHHRDHPHNPLLTSNSHDLVLTLEFKLYGNKEVLPDLSVLPNPRLFGTHVPFASLPDSVKASGCRILYLCRNPFDTFVSSWVFYNKIRPKSLSPLTIEEAFDLYCNGVVRYGPVWTHMLGYWKASRERPDKVLFLKYEELKGDTGFQLKKVAEFLGCPFSLEEESDGVIERIIELCSFEKMRELEVNKTGKLAKNVENKNFFRKGEVGDWVNHFTPSMVEKLSNVMQEKLAGSGLSF